MGEPTKTSEHFKDLISEIKEEQPKCINFKTLHSKNTRTLVSKIVFANEFLEHGGFVNQYESELEADEEMLKLASQGQRIKDLTEENLKLTNKLNEQKIKTHWWPIGVLGLVCII